MSLRWHDSYPTLVSGYLHEVSISLAYKMRKSYMQIPAQTPRGSLIIVISLIVAMMLTILPIPVWAIWFRPAWVALVLIYWIIAVPHRVSICTAWLCGLFLDVLQGSLLGEHALSLIIIAYLAEKLHQQIRMFPLLQQAFCVMLLVLINQFILAVVQGMVSDNHSTHLFWLPTITSLILWPWIYIILRDCRRRFAIV